MLISCYLASLNNSRPIYHAICMCCCTIHTHTIHAGVLCNKEQWHPKQCSRISYILSLDMSLSNVTPNHRINLLNRLKSQTEFHVNKINKINITIANKQKMRKNTNLTEHPWPVYSLHH